MTKKCRLCDRVARKTGLCEPCYHFLWKRERRGISKAEAETARIAQLGKPKGGKCRLCERSARIGDLCKPCYNHLWKFRRYGASEEVAEAARKVFLQQRTKQTCDLCPRPHFAHDLCKLCYQSVYDAQEKHGISREEALTRRKDYLASGQTPQEYAKSKRTNESIWRMAQTKRRQWKERENAG